MPELTPTGPRPEKISSFEQQFANRKQYEVFGGVIEASFISPEKPKTDVPVVLAPGWGETLDVFKRSAAVLAEAGRPVIVLDHPRRASALKKADLEKAGEERDLPVDELRKAVTILTILDEQNIEQADIITHSEGSINGTLAAFLAPEKIRDMVFMNPAGLIGKDTVPRLLGRFARKNWQNIVLAVKDKTARGPVVQGQKAGGKYFIDNPHRAYKEIRAISRSEIEEMIKEVHDSGIGTAVIAGVDDPGFPMQRMQQVVKSDAQPDGFVDGFISVRGGHDEAHIYADRYMGAAEKLLTALNEKSKTRRETVTDAQTKGIWEILRTKRSKKAITPLDRKHLNATRDTDGKFPAPSWGIEIERDAHPKKTARKLDPPSWGW